MADARNPRPVVAHVLHRLHLAGAEVLAAELSRRLSDRFRFVFLCLDDVGPLGEKLQSEGFDVVGLERRPGIDWRVPGRIRRAVRRFGVSILHAHQYTPFFYAAAARRCGLGKRPPVLFTEHGRHYPDSRSTKRVWANGVLLKPGDEVSAVGTFIRIALVENEGVPPDRIEVIYNGINPDLIPADTGNARALARHEMDVRDEDLVILQVARFHPVKDHVTAIEAFARVAAEEPRARLVLVGDGEQRDALEALARELGVAVRVRFMGVRDDVPSLLPGADVFLLSSLSEGISVTLLEAMAARLPIAATAVGGTPEVVEHLQTGLLSARRDAPALAANLITLLRDEPMRRRMGEAGRARLLERFTQDRMHDAYARLYERMLG